MNETKNSVYNPVTNTTQNFTDWNYDYSDRSYNLTLESGDTMTVTYGDENITINEGGTTYNVYYISEYVPPTPTPTPTPHVHIYNNTITREASCVLSGIRTYTCIDNDDSYTEEIPALGHIWQIKQEVKTEYDESGELVQEGYTVYQCSRCGEEYKAESNTSPPNTGGGTSAIKTSGVFSGIFGLFWDFTSFMLDLFSDFIAGGISGFLGAITDGTSDFFGILNPLNWFV